MTEVVVAIIDGGTSPEHLDELTVDLGDTLRQSLVDAVGRGPGTSAPSGTRGSELAELGVLVIQVALDTGILMDVVQRIRDWRDRRAVQQVEVVLGEARLVLSNASPEQQRELVDHFIRVTSSGAS